MSFRASIIASNVMSVTRISLFFMPRGNSWCHPEKMLEVSNLGGLNELKDLLTAHRIGYNPNIYIYFEAPCPPVPVVLRPPLPAHLLNAIHFSFLIITARDDPPIVRSSDTVMKYRIKLPYASTTGLL
jgi:hypothetical protein